MLNNNLYLFLLNYLNIFTFTIYSIITINNLNLCNKCSNLQENYLFNLLILFIFLITISSLSILSECCLSNKNYVKIINIFYIIILFIIIIFQLCLFNQYNLLKKCITSNIQCESNNIKDLEISFCWNIINSILTTSFLIYKIKTLNDIEYSNSSILNINSIDVNDTEYIRLR